MPRQLKIPWPDAMLECAQHHTEAPDRFILWSAISVLGSVLKNKVWIVDGLYKLFPNQYIILVAPPGIGKGTAVNFAWDVVREIAPATHYLVNMLSDRITAPKMLERIANGWNSAPQIVNQQILQTTKDHSCTIFTTELGGLIGASDWMLEFLCESWDKNRYEYDTKNSGSAFVKDMCTSLIGNTVPDYLRGIDRDSKLSVKGGFTSRCLFIYEDKIARDLLFPPPIASRPASVALMGQLRADLDYISKLPGGEMTYNYDAKIVFERFIRSARSNTDMDPDALLHFKSRIRAHVLKLAMILHLAHADDLIITGLDMVNAVSYVNGVLATMDKVFRGAGDSELASATARVQTYIEGKGGATRKELLQHLHRHISTETLDRILYTLTEIGYLMPKTTAGSKSTMYVKC